MQTFYAHSLHHHKSCHYVYCQHYVAHTVTGLLQCVAAAVLAGASITDFWWVLVILAILLLILIIIIICCICCPRCRGDTYYGNSHLSLQISVFEVFSERCPLYKFTNYLLTYFTLSVFLSSVRQVTQKLSWVDFSMKFCIANCAKK